MRAPIQARKLPKAVSRAVIVEALLVFVPHVVLKCHAEFFSSDLPLFLRNMEMTQFHDLTTNICSRNDLGHLSLFDNNIITMEWLSSDK